ncbi:MAG: hypothetical protein INR66_21000 [Gordonia polyisoprenivorans]|nr:hypothetical protein [Gordonia polyisoprenivorans]
MSCEHEWCHEDGLAHDVHWSFAYTTASLSRRHNNLTIGAGLLIDDTDSGRHGVSIHLDDHRRIDLTADLTPTEAIELLDAVLVAIDRLAVLSDEDARSYGAVLGAAVGRALRSGGDRA